RRQPDQHGQQQQRRGLDRRVEVLKLAAVRADHQPEDRRAHHRDAQQLRGQQREPVALGCLVVAGQQLLGLPQQDAQQGQGRRLPAHAPSLPKPSTQLATSTPTRRATNQLRPNQPISNNVNSGATTVPARRSAAVSSTHAVALENTPTAASETTSIGVASRVVAAKNSTTIASPPATRPAWISARPSPAASCSGAAARPRN